MIALSYLMFCSSLLSTYAVSTPYHPPSYGSQEVIEEVRPTIPVPVTLGVMSRCPDALLCEDVFDKVLDKVGHSKVDLGLSFVGRLNSSEPTYGVTCLHGPEECAGNIHELCTIRYTSDSSVWWPFLHCLNYQGKERIGTEKAATYCAQVAKIDWSGSGIEACVNGDEGKELLRESVRETAELGIEKSCTILINGKLRCIRDGAWKQCDQGHQPSDFVDTINNEYDRLNGDSN